MNIKNVIYTLKQGSTVYVLLRKKSNAMDKERVENYFHGLCQTLIIEVER